MTIMDTSMAPQKCTEATEAHPSIQALHGGLGLFGPDVARRRKPQALLELGLHALVHRLRKAKALFFKRKGKKLREA